MSSPATDRTSIAPSRPSWMVYSLPSATRYAFPCACQLDDVIGDLPRGAVGADHSDAGDAPHPLALVGGGPPRAHDEGGDRLLAWERRHLVEPERLARGGRDRSGKRPVDLLLHARLEHGARALLDPALEHVLRKVEADHDRRVPRRARPEPVLSRRERRARLRELEGADDPAAVVRVDGGGSGGVEALQVRVRRVRAA